MPTLSHDGVGIHYQVHGDNGDDPPVLLSHGYGATSLMWAPNLPAITAVRQVITWDLRGHGETGSPADPARYSPELSVADMAAILDACGHERAVIGGMSLGGFLSLAFRLAHPDRTAALLLVDTGPGYKNDEARQKWNDSAERMAAAIAAKGIDALGTSPELRAGRHDPAGLALAARHILTQRDATVIGSLADIAVPTLIVVGADDRPYLAATDYMTAKIPDAVKVVIPDAGHASNMDRPAAFNAAVTEWLSGL
jgi:pimeloyl-ACP methyl ester carboxylesterase